MHTVMESGGLRFPNRGVPKNAVRHAFATKNAVKGEVAMGVEGGHQCSGKMSRKLCKTLGHGSHVGKFCLGMDKRLLFESELPLQPFRPR